MRTLKALLFGLLLVMPGPARAVHHHYSDVPEGHWAQEGIDALYENGIYHNSFGDRFYGERLMNRYQLAILVSKLLYIQEETFRPWPLVRRQLDRIGARLSEATSDLRDLSARVDRLAESMRPPRSSP